MPHTQFPSLNGSGGYIPRPESCFSPMPTRDHLQEVEEETAAIVNQVSQFSNRFIFLDTITHKNIIHFYQNIYDKIRALCKIKFKNLFNLNFVPKILIHR